MKALITGASSGIGRDMAAILSARGYDIIAVARSQEHLAALASELPTRVQTIALDLSVNANCYALYEQLKDDAALEIVINNAGYGIYGQFWETSLEDELNMCRLNMEAVHILTKLFLPGFMRRDRGYILNVASAASFVPGPKLASYYAGKAYVLRLTEALAEELRQAGSNVYVGVLNPGPTDTNFNQRAQVAFTVRSQSSRAVAEIAINGMLARKWVIIAGAQNKLLWGLRRFVPLKTLLKFTYMIQQGKRRGE